MPRQSTLEIGQLVEVRSRHYVVQEVEASSLPDSRIPQHVVSLACIDDDGFGEDLQVVWEIEPGSRIHDKPRLPNPATGFDSPDRLDAFLNAVRWGAISSADTQALQAPFRSGIQIEDYQLDPLVRAVRMPRVNLLIADDVGLGKTIESGLVVQELILRHRVRTVLIVCPAPIQVQWQEQMQEKFGLEFRIVDSELFHRLRRERGLHVNPWTHFPRLITSMDFLKRDGPFRLFREKLPPEGAPAFPRAFDLLIVDEAHNIAPSGGSRYVRDSRRTAVIRHLVRHFEHKLFVTATPHNGYIQSFSALLELLDNQRFARSVRPDSKQLAAIMVRRLKSDFSDWADGQLFPGREIQHMEVGYPEEERRAHAALAWYTKLRLDASQSASETVAAEFVLKLLKKRLFSSPAAFAETLATHIASLTRAGRVSPSLKALQRQIEEVEEDRGDEETSQAEQDAVDTAGAALPALSLEETALLEELQRFAEDARGRADAKARVLIQWLKDTLKPGGSWNGERALIFTEYRDTHKWLLTQLNAHGLADKGRVECLVGGMPSKERERVKAAFQASPDTSPVRILLATDAASEGIDLQNHCRQLVHYEIPWNPNRMEQRNGRLDRHGQRRKVQIHHFVAKGFEDAVLPGMNGRESLDTDLDILWTVVKKVECIRQDIGKVGPVIATQVEEAMLGKRHALDTAREEREAVADRELLRAQRNLREEVRRIHTQLLDTRRDLDLSPENLLHVVEVGLALAEQPPLEPATLDDGTPAFRLPTFLGNWDDCIAGLLHPHTKRLRPVTFDHEVAAGRDDVVLVHLNHRLVQRCLRLLRAEIWSDTGANRLNRVTARVVPDSWTDVPVVVAHGRLVILGGDGRRLHEEVIAAGGAIRGKEYERWESDRVESILDAATDRSVPDPIHQQLQGIWAGIERPLLKDLVRRKQYRFRSRQSQLDRQCRDEQDRITSVMEELRQAILSQLGKEEDLQLRLWPDEEKEQFERDRSALAERAARIPQEIEQETEAIRRRFAEPTARLFPAAVTFLVPARLARAAGGHA